MQMQSIIFNYAYFLLLMMAKMSKSYQSHFNTRSILSSTLDPRFRQFEEPYIQNSTLLVENQVPNRQGPAYQLPQPQTSTWQTAGIARYRNEGNFYGAQPFIGETKPIRAADLQIESKKHYLEPTSLFNHRVYHADTWRSTVAPQYAASVYRQRRLDNESLPKTIATAPAKSNANGVDKLSARNAIALTQQLRDVRADQIYDDTADAVEQNFEQDPVGEQPPPLNEIRSFHDIYMRMAGPNELNLFGHVEHGPHLFEQRFESQNKGNRFKGEVLWADDTGGYGKQYWDLAQGKL